ncbi:glycoside hydrolase family 88 protein [Psychrobacter sp. Arc29]|uniref:glycoside hydrolase family 88 protein n=1 Tax=Psychrobacter sp. Arc29 TaxID=3046690 RepID=UPI00352D7475
MVWFFFITLFFASIVSFLCLYIFINKKKRKPIATVDYPNIAQASDSVIRASLDMLKNKRTVMSFNDEDSLYVKLSKLKAWFKRDDRQKRYAYFNFPLAFLLLGIIDTYESSGESVYLNKVEARCRDFISEDGELLFTFDKVDQAMFGLVFLRLYIITKSKKYLIASDKVYRNVLFFVADDGIVRYRKGVNVAFIDTIGLVCPFLIMYSEITDCEQASILAKRQIKNVMDIGLEKNGILPFHAIDLTLNMPLGPVNWGRGLGWWVLGLAPLAAKSSLAEPNEYMITLQNLVKFLDTARLDKKYWAQFIGHTNDNTIDSSATLMFLLASQQGGLESIKSNELLSVIKHCVNSSGVVTNSSGDTIYINKYSRAKGASELAQGLMLSLLSKVTL